MTGYLHIFRSDVATGTYVRPVPEFQLTYTSGRHSWARTFDEDGLEEFLLSELALAPESTAEIMQRIRTDGNATIPDVSVSEEEMSAMKLLEMPSDM